VTQARTVHPSADASYHLAERKKSSGRAYLASILAPLNVRPGAAVLDVGCGSGYVSTYLSQDQNVRRNLALDLVPDTLRLARELSAGGAARAVHWICGRAEALPVPSGSVDHLVCRVVLPYTAIPQAIAEISRSLSTQGSALLQLHPWTMYTTKLSLHPRKWKASVAVILTLLVGGLFHLTGVLLHPRLGRWRIGETFQTVSRMRKLFTQHGLCIYRVQSQPEFILYVVKSRASSL
jgi:SAM-dependent methyltransferase